MRRATALLLAVLCVGALFVVPTPVPAAPGDDLCGTPMDVLFLFDTTASMGGVLDAAKAGASTLMADVAAQAGDVRFGVADYRDHPGAFSYPGYYATFGASGDYPWQLGQAFTTNQAAADVAIHALHTGNGADWPESLSRALYEANALAWRPDAVKLVVLFADAPPHDADFDGKNYGQDPGPDGVMSADDLDYETVVAALAASGVKVIVVDSGGGVSAPWFQHAAQQTAGAYALLQNDFVSQVRGLILAHAPRVGAYAEATALHAAAAVPVNPSVTLAPVKARGNEVRIAHVLDELVPPVNGHVKVAKDWARAASSASALSANASTTLAEVSLLGGLVRARGIDVAVESATNDSGSASLVPRAVIAELWVGTTRYEADLPPNTLIPLPGGGILLVKETRHATHELGSEVLVNALRLVVDNGVERGEVTVGHAFAGTRCGGALGELLADPDNDAGVGGDSPADPANATSVFTPNVFQGRLLAGDAADHYRVYAEPGLKVEALLVPSARATVTLGPTLAQPSLPDLSLALLEPGTFAVRETSELPQSTPERVELNVDRAGDWVVRVTSANAVPANYTLALVVTPLAPFFSEDAYSGQDAPAGCGAGLTVGTGLHAGSLHGADMEDAYRVSVEGGDLVALTLKPTEDADGADFDLRLYDPACNLVQASTLGKDVSSPGLVPKGLPEALFLPPAPLDGVWHVEVVRYNGVGNYYLNVAVLDPQPTLAPLAGEGGGDAGDSPATATPFPVPGVVQGRAPPGDQEDWYSFHAFAGQRIVATLHGQAGSDYTLNVLRPSGPIVGDSHVPLSATEAVVVDADETGVWHARVIRHTGGGDYLLGVAAL